MIDFSRPARLCFGFFRLARLKTFISGPIWRGNATYGEIQNTVSTVAIYENRSMSAAGKCQSRNGATETNRRDRFDLTENRKLFLGCAAFS